MTIGQFQKYKVSYTKVSFNRVPVVNTADKNCKLYAQKQT